MVFVSLTAGGRGMNFVNNDIVQYARRAIERGSQCRKSGHPGQSHCAKNARRRRPGIANKEIRLEIRFDRHDATR
jgi:hypothetical protein